MSPRRIAIIGAELDLGAGRRGVDMGPSAIRYAGIGERLAELGLEVSDRGNVETPVAETVAPGDEHARYLAQIKETCERIASEVAAADADGATPLVLGGDHSIALGSVGGMASRRGAGAAIWLDAHGDLNTPETSPSRKRPRDAARRPARRRRRRLLERGLAAALARSGADVARRGSGRSTRARRRSCASSASASSR